jgi:hypothetical protein
VPAFHQRLTATWDPHGASISPPSAAAVSQTPQPPPTAVTATRLVPPPRNAVSGRFLGRTHLQRVALLQQLQLRRGHPLFLHGGVELQSKRLLIESRWVSKPLAFAGKLRPRRPNSEPL